MFNSAILDVAVALAFVFLLASLLVSALNELIAGLFKQRAKSLWRGIAELVRSESLRDALYDHPLIKSIAPPLSGGIGSKSMQGPSYIPAKTFTVVLLDLLKEPSGTIRQAQDGLARVAADLKVGGSQSVATMAARVNALAQQMPDSPTGSALSAELGTLSGQMAVAGASLPDIIAAVDRVRLLLPAKLNQSLETTAGKYSTELAAIVRTLGDEAAGSIDGLRTAIEHWFDQGMDRVSGWYKRWTQYWQFLLGFALAALLNINTVTIGNALWTNIPLRNSVVAEAEGFAKNPNPSIWVPDSDSGKTEGDFQIEVHARPTTTDRVLVRVVLPAKAPKDVPVDVKVSDEVMRLTGPLVVRKDSLDGEVEGIVEKQLPLEMRLEASYVEETENAKANRTARRTVKVMPGDISRFDQTRRQLTATQLPVGWPEGPPHAIGLSMLFGWLLTAIAVSFGAPFWFDTLNQFVRLRAGGPKVDEKNAAEKKG